MSETKPQIPTKFKLARFGALVTKLSPKIAITAGCLVVLYYAQAFIVSQQSQLKALTDTVSELRTQNAVIIDANKALDADMKAIKAGMDVFNSRLIDINRNTKSLEAKFKDQSFQELLKTDPPKAEEQFNLMFNDYLRGFNDDTVKFAK